MAHIYGPTSSGKYRIQYRDARGRRRDVKGYTSLRETKSLAAALEDQVTAERLGVRDPRAEAAMAADRLPLSAHIDAWRDSIVAKGSKKNYAELNHTRVSNVFALGNGGKGYLRLTDLNSDDVQQIVTAMMGLDEASISQQTANHTIQACRQFSRWCWQTDRTRDHMLKRLSRYAITSFKHARTAFAWADVEKMLAYVENEQPCRGGNPGLPGKERAMLYRVALATGFRARALRSLTPQSFCLDPGAESVTVLPGYAKNKKPLTVPLAPAFAETLRTYLAGKPKGVPVWRVSARAAELLRRDFRKAGVELPSDGLARDFHCLRHTFITSVIESGADLRTAQALAGHCTPTLTARYTHPTDERLRSAVSRLPVNERGTNKEGEAKS